MDPVAKISKAAAAAKLRFQLFMILLRPVFLLPVNWVITVLANPGGALISPNSAFNVNRTCCQKAISA
jgi:hypothetical protein